MVLKKKSHSIWNIPESIHRKLSRAPLKEKNEFFDNSKKKSSKVKKKEKTTRVGDIKKYNLLLIKGVCI